MVLWNITVTDITTNMGVANAKVCLLAGGGALCWPPEQADYTAYTDANGLAAIDVTTGFYRVGIIVEGYESAHDPHNPPEGCVWWTCTGAGGAGSDYDFAVTPTGVPEPNGVAKSPLLVALPLALGAGLIGISLVSERI